MTVHASTGMWFWVSAFKHKKSGNIWPCLGKNTVVLESDHYNSVRKYNLWDEGKRFEKGIEETHASIIGFHHWPREWLEENQEVARRLANKCGYWYFPKYAVLPDTLRKNSERNYLRMTWENHGVAPAYHRYNLRMQLLNLSSGRSFILDLAESDNRKWMPGRIVGEYYDLKLPASLPSGNMKSKLVFFIITGRKKSYTACPEREP